MHARYRDDSGVTFSVNLGGMNIGATTPSQLRMRAQRLVDDPNNQPDFNWFTSGGRPRTMMITDESLDSMINRLYQGASASLLRSNLVLLINTRLQYEADEWRAFNLATATQMPRLNVGFGNINRLNRYIEALLRLYKLPDVAVLTVGDALLSIENMARPFVEASHYGAEYLSTVALLPDPLPDFFGINMLRMHLIVWPDPRFHWPTDREWQRVSESIDRVGRWWQADPTNSSYPRAEIEAEAQRTIASHAQSLDTAEMLDWLRILLTKMARIGHVFSDEFWDHPALVDVLDRGQSVGFPDEWMTHYMFVANCPMVSNFVPMKGDPDEDEREQYGISLALTSNEDLRIMQALASSDTVLSPVDYMANAEACAEARRRLRQAATFFGRTGKRPDEAGSALVYGKFLPLDNSVQAREEAKTRDFAWQVLQAWCIAQTLVSPQEVNEEYTTPDQVNQAFVNLRYVTDPPTPTDWAPDGSYGTVTRAAAYRRTGTYTSPFLDLAVVSMEKLVLYASTIQAHLVAYAIGRLVRTRYQVLTSGSPRRNDDMGLNDDGDSSSETNDSDAVPGTDDEDEGNDSDDSNDGGRDDLPLALLQPLTAVPADDLPLSELGLGDVDELAAEAAAAQDREVLQLGTTRVDLIIKLLMSYGLAPPKGWGGVRESNTLVPGTAQSDGLIGWYAPSLVPDIRVGLPPPPPSEPIPEPRLVKFAEDTIAKLYAPLDPSNASWGGSEYESGRVRFRNEQQREAAEADAAHELELQLAATPTRVSAGPFGVLHRKDGTLLYAGRVDRKARPHGRGLIVLRGGPTKQKTVYVAGEWKSGMRVA